jgi:hypothetical protein
MPYGLQKQFLFMQTKSGYVERFPYSYAYGRFPKYDPQVNEVQWISLGYSVLFLIIGFLDFRRG